MNPQAAIGSTDCEQPGWAEEKGALAQAIRISRGGGNSKLHALTDGEVRPPCSLLTSREVADCAADVLLDSVAPRAIVLADKASQQAIRDLIERPGAYRRSRPRPTGTGKTAFLGPSKGAQRRRAPVK
ncbi:hypothetical protein F7D01_10575 [Erythrobacter sp. 3-20A1M]|uniref:hypothetical protein n=1 Tax=Erythrobacter sp. 3-20A1M TaxID=2653850 RepID=UPI001BFC1891|nr:hypothetical protein [Erythrobacter sp. 3-20A1M]QWC57466.1 hypothetical protein F7D01_10575 [Erythrobacter sp. 3-20A1M]